MNVGSQLPALAFPKFRRQDIYLEHIDMALENTYMLKLDQATRHQGTCHAHPPERRQYNEVLQVSAASVVSTHDATNDLMIRFCNKTKFGIALQVPLRPDA